MGSRKNIKKQIIRSTFVVFGVACLALFIWIVYLDRVVVSQFEGRRWTLPAQVYAQPLELYA
jgi:penicillin-binding protein 1B